MAEKLTNAMIESLRTSAGQAGDMEMVAICDKALKYFPTKPRELKLTLTGEKISVCDSCPNAVDHYSRPDYNDDFKCTLLGYRIHSPALPPPEECPLPDIPDWSRMNWEAARSACASAINEARAAEDAEGPFVLVSP